jgi:hypothetical protein
MPTVMRDGSCCRSGSMTPGSRFCQICRSGCRRHRLFYSIEVVCWRCGRKRSNIPSTASARKRRSLLTSPGSTRIPAFVKVCAAARRKQDAARAKERERREQAVAKAQRHSKQPNGSMTPGQAPSMPRTPPGRCRNRSWSASAPRAGIRLDERRDVVARAAISLRDGTGSPATT